MKSIHRSFRHIYIIILSIYFITSTHPVKAQGFEQVNKIEVKEIELLPGILSPKSWYKKDSHKNNYLSWSIRQRREYF